MLSSTNIDENRILMEAGIFSEKTAVDEETVRLRSHIAQFRTMLESGEPVGRKLDFLVQERDSAVAIPKVRSSFSIIVFFVWV